MTARKLHTKFEKAGGSPGFLLWQGTNLWQRRQQAVLKEFNLTHVQFVLLAGLTWLSGEDENITQIALSRFTRTDRMMTSQVVRTLVKKGLLTRSRHPTDTRAYIVKVTDAGLELVNRAIISVESTDREFFSVLSGEDISNLVRMLSLLSRQ
ncbi:MAG: MarR family winged helix-turn-helix transcriptional regulator [Thermoplasmataceae archaeon]